MVHWLLLVIALLLSVCFIFSVVCEMREMDPWKMRESKEGDPEVVKRFCVWKMQEAS